MDPNWFYSTLAQSMAAIVGLAGGFLFTWLLSRRADGIAERRQYVDRLHALIAQLESLRIRAEARTVRTIEILQNIRDQRAAGCAHETLVVPRFETLSHGPYDVAHPSEDDLIVLESLPSLYRRLTTAIVNERDVLAAAILCGNQLELRDGEFRSLEVRSSPFADSGIGPDNFWSGLRQQKEFGVWEWRESAREFDRLACAVLEFRHRLVPRSIYFLITVLFILVAAGIVSPMIFLSAQEGPSKWILLGVSAPLVLAFIGYLGYEVWRLRHAADLARDNV